MSPTVQTPTAATSIIQTVSARVSDEYDRNRRNRLGKFRDPALHPCKTGPQAVDRPNFGRDIKMVVHRPACGIAGIHLVQLPNRKLGVFFHQSRADAQQHCGNRPLFPFQIEKRKTNAGCLNAVKIAFMEASVMPPGRLEHPKIARDIP